MGKIEKRILNLEDFVLDNKGRIDWKENIGLNVKVFYENKEYVIQITDYNTKEGKITFTYLNKVQKPMNTGNFMKCKFGNIFENYLQLSNQEYLELIENWKLEYKEEIKNGNINKIFTDNLPRNGKKINWEESVNYKVYFIYNTIEGWIKIVNNYSGKNIDIEYFDKEIFKINKSGFQNACLGGVLKTHTSDFKVEIRTSYKDDKRDIIIIDKEIRPRYRNDGKIENQKWYKYHCNKCGYEDWIEESSLIGNRKTGCSCCVGKPVLGINTIWNTDKWMVPYVGEEVAKTHTYCSGKKIFPVCPDCGRIKLKEMEIYSIYTQHSIGCSCSDKIPYPEKTMFSVLEQLKIDFRTQLSKTTFEWCKNYSYDFYFELNEEQYVVETHGIQHYEECKLTKRTLQEEQENDRLKKELALYNGIKDENYIVIDCRKSEMKWIRDHILESNLAKIFDLSKIDWLKTEEYALSNLVKIVCEYWNKGIENLEEIAKIMKIGRSTTYKYIKQGVIFNWCNYDGQEEAIKNNNNQSKRNKKNLSKPIICTTTIQVFESAKECERVSLKIFGVKLYDTNISRVCHNKYSHTGKLKFKFISDLTPEEYIKYDIVNKLKELEKCA